MKHLCVIFLIAIPQLASLGCSGIRVGVVEHSITREKVEDTFVPSYSVTNLELRKAADMLSLESEKYGNELGYQPVKFRVENTLANEPVTLTLRDNSMDLIIKVLAQQTDSEIVIKDHEVLFSKGEWDALD